MIKEVHIKSFGAISSLDVQQFGKINLLIGQNGTGKTFALKAMYAAQKCIEQYGRGKEPRSVKELLADSLYWTFQPEMIGSLVKKGESPLSFLLKSDTGDSFQFSFGNTTTKEIKNVESTFAPTSVNSIFLPAKEVISIQDSIIRLYDVDKMFGFDKTYVDLARAMSKTVKGRNYKEFSTARNKLQDAIGGRLEFDDVKKSWAFMDNGKRSIAISLTSEGIKRLSVLELLLGNHYLSKESVVFIDEAEANLHPELISKFMDIVVLMAEAGVQFFISSHSYFVIKNLYILAHENNISVPTISFEETGAKIYDLHDGMPDNPIVRESVNLYRREINL